MSVGNVTSEDFVRFLNMANTLRHGSMEEQRKLRTSKDDVEFLVRMTDAGVVDNWLKAVDEILGEE